MARILVVDDEEAIRRMLKQVLERAGHQVATACDGLEATRMQNSTPYDLLITDLIMPEKEGIETIRELSRSFPQLPIIAMSGGGRVAPGTYLDMAQRLGAAKTFTKPIAHKELLETVAGLLSAPA